MIVREQISNAWSEELVAVRNNTGSSLSAFKFVVPVGVYTPTAPDLPIPTVEVLSSLSQKPVGLLLSSLPDSQSTDYTTSVRAKKRGIIQIIGFDTSAAAIGDKVYCTPAGDPTLSSTDIEVGIVLVLSTNGTIYLNLGSGSAAAISNVTWQEYPFSYTDFSTAGLTSTLDVVTLVGKTVSQARVKHSTAFAGAGITEYSVKVGVSGELDRYLNEFDVAQAVSANAKKRAFLNLEEDVTVKITAESVGANLDQASAGALSLKLLLTDVEPSVLMNSEFSFGAGIGDGVNAIAVGEVGSSVIPYSGTIVGWYIIGDVSGSIVVDVWKDSFANYPPTVADTITGTEKPTLSSQNKNSDLTLTTWNTTVNAGDVVRFKVDSVDGTLKAVSVLILCSRG